MLAPWLSARGRLKLKKKLPDAREHWEAFYIAVDGEEKPPQSAAEICIEAVTAAAGNLSSSPPRASQLAKAAASQILGAGAADGVNSAGQRSDTE